MSIIQGIQYSYWDILCNKKSIHTKKELKGSLLVIKEGINTRKIAGKFSRSR